MEDTNKVFIIVENETENKETSYNLIVSEDEKILDKYFPQGNETPRKFYKVLTTVEVAPTEKKDEPTEEPAESTDGNVS